MKTQIEDREVIFRVSVTFSSYGPDGMAAGEADASGYRHESDDYDAQELSTLSRNLGLSAASIEETGNGLVVSFCSETPDESRAYFEEGISTFYTAHLETVNGEKPTYETAALAAEAMGITPVAAPSYHQDPEPY